MRSNANVYIIKENQLIDHYTVYQHALPMYNDQMLAMPLYNDKEAKDNSNTQD